MVGISRQQAFSFGANFGIAVAGELVCLQYVIFSIQNIAAITCHECPRALSDNKVNKSSRLGELQIYANNFLPKRKHS